MTKPMSKKSLKSLAEIPKDIAIDYVLIAAGAAAGLIGLIYLVWI